VVHVTLTGVDPAMFASAAQIPNVFLNLSCTQPASGPTMVPPTPVVDLLAFLLLNMASPVGFRPSLLTARP